MATVIIRVTLSYLIDLTSGSVHAMATVQYYILSYLIGPTSGDAQDWIITFKPWLLPRIQGNSN